MKVLRTLIAGAALVAVVGVAPAGASTRRPPPSCVRALNAAEVLFDEVVIAFNIVSETFGAAADFDAAAVGEGADKLNERAEKIKPLRANYDREAAKCRAVR